MIKAMYIYCVKCGAKIGRVVGRTMVEIKRKDKNTTIVGRDYSLMIPCSMNCTGRTPVIVENGKLLEANTTKPKDLTV